MHAVSVVRWIWDAHLAQAVLVLLVVAVTGDSSKDLDVALLENRNTEVLHCAARGRASQSAITWIAPITKYWKEPYSAIINRSPSTWDCEPNGICYNWKTAPFSTTWNKANSLTTPAPPLTDYRWEGLHHLVTDDKGSVQHLTLIPGNTESWAIDVSVRAVQNAHIFLCDGEKDDWHSSSCYYIILGGWSNEDTNHSALRRCNSGEINLDTTHGPKEPCLYIRAVEKEMMVSRDTWLHLTIKWSTLSNEVSVWKHGEANPFLRYEHNNPTPVTNMLVRTINNFGFWKLHSYYFWYTDKYGAYLESEYLKPTHERACLAFQYFLSPNSYFDISARPGVELEEYQFEDDGKWHEARIISKQNTMEHIKVTITIQSTTGARTTHAGIGNIRECNPNGETRISNWPRWKGNATCQLLQFPKRPLSSNKQLSDGETGCENGNIMTNCIENCQTLLGVADCKYYAICLPKGTSQFCNCGTGYKGDRCDVDCDVEHYGPGCRHQCGKCKYSDRCDRETGVCEEGCQPGYQSERCHIIDSPCYSLPKHPGLLSSWRRRWFAHRGLLIFSSISTRGVNRRLVLNGLGRVLTSRHASSMTVTIAATVMRAALDRAMGGVSAGLHP